MQHALSSKLKGLVALNKGVHDVLDDFCWILTDIASRPTKIAELKPLLASAKGHHDASGKGAGGICARSDAPQQDRQPEHVILAAEGQCNHGKGAFASPSSVWDPPAIPPLRVEARLHPWLIWTPTEEFMDAILGALLRRQAPPESLIVEPSQPAPAACPPSGSLTLTWPSAPYSKPLRAKFEKHKSSDHNFVKEKLRPSEIPTGLSCLKVTHMARCHADHEPGGPRSR
ncbi:hypothetical protein THAOC_05710 [Thalassiosira oceanica]|uniref:Uncharacterized protein n=1 Tax=Thalassiosira oceanica TaxID=159749 RepID=K0T527_THAOC|nr:hypothetical protein THAOC_05710 [Thalassiosira oceanica]|eukprot:EJK72730.1 hypothetical protein THAOC_05710 [Thalassiosira oceanica]